MEMNSSHHPGTDSTSDDGNGENDDLLTTHNDGCTTSDNDYVIYVRAWKPTTIFRYLVRNY